MKLRDTTAGALAAWQAMTMTGTYAPPAPTAAPEPSQSAISAWSSMTGTTPSAPQTLPAGTPFQPGTAGGFTVKEPAKPGVGSWANPVTGSYAGMGPATTPLVDNPTQLPSFGPSTPPPATAPEPPAAVAELPAATPEDKRALTVDEKRFAQENALLSAAYQQGFAVAPYLATAGMPPIVGDTKQPGTRRDGYALQASESFEGGVGLFSRTWGPGVDTSVPGQVTIRRFVDGSGKEIDSGTMVPPTGTTAGYGYGLYTFDLSMTGTAPGPYALLWPGTDVWPGPEMDLVERTAGGGLYSTLHWKDGGGDNAFSSIGLGDVDGSQRHTYQYDWQPTGLTVYVDGRNAGTFANAPKSAADGGENAAPGIGMQTWWSKNEQSACSGVCADNSITLYGFSYESAGR